MGRGNQRVAIVGGGISGMVAAEQLAALDPAVEIDLFEASERLGGVLQTEHVEGFCLELGPDSMLSRLPWGVDLCRRIGLEEELVSTNPALAGAHVVCRGRLQRIPDGLAIMAPQRIWPIVTTPILSWRGKLRLAAEYIIPRRKTEEDESLANFIRRRLGRETLERLVQPLAGGIYMGDPGQLSIQATFPQFVEMERQHGSLIRAARAARSQGQARGGHGGPQYSLFVAPRRGMTQLVEALAERLSGCRIRFRQQVKSLLPDDDGGWLVDVLDRATGDCGQEAYAGIILALPAWHAGSVLTRVNGQLAGQLAQIPYAGCIAVNLAYDRSAVSHPLDSFGFVTPHVERRPVLACTFSSVKYPGRAPDGKVVFRTYLGGACFPEVLQWPDERVLRVVQDELRELLGVAGPPLVFRITRWPCSMAQYHVGHLDRVRRIETLVSKLPGLELAGNSYHGVGIPQCIRSGEQASERLLATLGHAVQLQPETPSRQSDEAIRNEV